MNLIRKLTFAIIIFLNLDYQACAESVIKKIEFSNNNLVISVNEKTGFRTYALSSPDRLVVDIDDASLEDDEILEQNFPNYIGAVRKGRKDDALRIVFELKKQIYIKKTSFQKTKNDDYGKITVVLSDDAKDAAANIKKADIHIKSNSEIVKPPKVNVESKPQHPTTELDVMIKYVIKNEPIPPSLSKIAAKENAANVKLTKPEDPENKQQNEVEVKPTKIPNKIPVIVIDAGHGGKDPGTIGDYARTKEKNVTLSYAKELAKHLINTKHYKVYLTRDSDEFIPLKQRVEKARRIKADLFISLHADSASDKDTSGLSIYTLSEKSSDRQAELLAQKENRADIIAGLNFADTSGDILKTLIDLSQRSSMNSSSQFANSVIKSMQKNEIDILQNTHRFAGFVVLTAPDMTSILIELGYLSNKNEESELNSLGHKRDIVKALVDAIDEYFKMAK